MKALPEYEWGDSGLELLYSIQQLVHKYGGEQKTIEYLSSEWAKSVWRIPKSRKNKKYSKEEIEQVSKGIIPKDRSIYSYITKRVALRKKGYILPKMVQGGWSWAEMEYLNENYKSMPIQQIADNLGRNYFTVSQKAYRMGLRKFK